MTSTIYPADRFPNECTVLQFGTDSTRGWCTASFTELRYLFLEGNFCEISVQEDRLTFENVIDALVPKR